MVQSFPIHLGYILTDNLSHQGQYVRVRVLPGDGSYRGHSRSREGVIIPSPLDLDTLRIIGIVKRTALDKYALVVPLDDLGNENEEPEDTQPGSSSQPMPMETEVPPTAEKISPISARTHLHEPMIA